MDLKKIKDTLTEFTKKKDYIQGVVLVNEDGELITKPPIGDWDETTTYIIAGIMGQLIQRICQQLNWNNTKEIYVETEDGYIMLLVCAPSIFLLVKASSNTNRGLLKGEIALILANLQTDINTISSTKDIEGGNGKGVGRW
ncbi:MAG: roadblock/LC7 domain-containing protein [Moorea sp. SIO4A1]|uniref:roadblock/LC7 domain-containing protein n=1 Tax=Moorena sp. SIO4A1 TaxID=2607835 RepID=UPI00144E37C9|nr:roadblock/LC7 domain-containing protein [Moorena sp. SIO4A1]NEQ59225.1 roadblock/LC7 domain-containing protein [Moorena sp. SIO4A1]